MVFSCLYETDYESIAKEEVATFYFYGFLHSVYTHRVEACPVTYYLSSS